MHANIDYVMDGATFNALGVCVDGGSLVLNENKQARESFRWAASFLDNQVEGISRVTTHTRIPPTEIPAHFVGLGSTNQTEWLSLWK